MMPAALVLLSLLLVGCGKSKSRPDLENPAAPIPLESASPSPRVAAAPRGGDDHEKLAAHWESLARTVAPHTHDCDAMADALERFAGGEGVEMRALMQKIKASGDVRGASPRVMAALDTVRSSTAKCASNTRVRDSLASLYPK